MLIYEHDIHIYIYTHVLIHTNTNYGNTQREWADSLSLLCLRTPSSLLPPPSFYCTESSFKPAVSCVTPWRVHIRSHKFYVQGRHKRHPERSAFAFFSGTSFPGVIQV